MPDGSKIFAAYRAVGYVSNHVPLVIMHPQGYKEKLVITCIGKSFHSYGCTKFGLKSVSTSNSGDIQCLTADLYHIYTACGNVIQAWKRGIEVKQTFVGHEKPIHALLVFGCHLVSVDEGNILRLWDINSTELYLEMTFSLSSFQVTVLMHPSTYLNKLLLGSEQGSLQLWNLKTTKLIYTFPGWGSPVTVLEQAPAIDVAAIGLASGEIILHNLKFDETIMKFMQDWGRITTITFCTDGNPVMGTGSTLGHIALWNLEEKKLISQIHNAHRLAVTGMKYLQGEPIIVTSSPDNTLKMWLIDKLDVGGRLLRIREGHSKPPIRIRFHGSSGNIILSAGQDSSLRSFSTITDMLNQSLGHAVFYSTKHKKARVKCHNKMPPIIDFTSETTREKEWDNIAACHRRMDTVTTWSFHRRKRGELNLCHKRLPQNISSKKPCALCVCLTSCGNFVLIGYDAGYVDRFNMQSGIYRGSYGNPAAHSGAVRGVVTDNLNQTTITGGSEGSLKFWRFKSGDFLSETHLGTSVGFMVLHRESSLLAVVLDDFSVQIIDVNTRIVVREFSGHTNRITDVAFSADSRWLITASMDRTIRVFDVPIGHLIDFFLVDVACTSLTMSPTGEYLATTHVDDLGIYLWSNCTLYSHVSLRPLPSNYKPTLVKLPTAGLLGTGTDAETEDGDTLEEEEISEFKSQEQIADELVTLALLPNSRWQNLLNLDVIKRRNKPKEPPKTPKTAPFFIPTIPGLEFKFAVPESDPKSDANSQVLKMSKLQQLSKFSKQLQESQDMDSYLAAFSQLKEMGPSTIDLEIRGLSPEGGGNVKLMLQFMKMINQVLNTKRYFEAAQAYLGLFLQIHGDIIASEDELRQYISTVQRSQNQTWLTLQDKLNTSLHLVSYLKSLTL